MTDRNVPLRAVRIEPTRLVVLSKEKLLAIASKQ